MRDMAVSVPSLAPLPNRLIEVAVIVGIDDLCGLNAVKTSEHTDYDPNETGLFETNFEAKLLAAVSAQHALFPFRFPPRDKDYPPNDWQFKRAASVGSRDAAFKQISPRVESLLQMSYDTARVSTEQNGTRPSSFPGNRRVSRKMSLAATLHYPNSSRDSASFIQTAPHLPVALDVLHNLAGLCYPDNILAESKPVRPSAQYLVLTDVEGTRSYATCLKFYKPYIIWQESDLKWEIRGCVQDDSEDLETGEHLVYLPQCVVFLSKFPYFSIIKDCLSRLVSSIMRHPSEMNTLVKRYTLQLSMTPVPPPGYTSLKFPLEGALFTLHPGMNAHSPIIDLPLKTVFEHFTPQDVLRVMTCILTQQKIVFLCSSYGLLTLISQAFLCMLDPFQWKAPYVPVLSRTMLELLEAPGSLLMGCHSQCIAQVNQVESLVIANIDTGEVSYCPTIHVPDMPDEPCFTFVTACGTIRSQRDAQHLEWLTPFNYEEMASLRHQRQAYFNDLIMNASAELLVHLFRDVLQHLKVEQRFFNRDLFLENVPVSYKDFYKEVLHTQMFNSFLIDRFAQRKDRWSVMEEKTRIVGEPEQPTALQMKRRGSSLTSPVHSSTKPRTSSSSEAPRESHDIILPMFAYDAHRIYYSKCIEMLACRARDSEDMELRAACTYLQAMFRVANNEPVQALQDCHALSTQNSSIFPTETVAKILSSLPPVSKESLKSQEFFRQSDEWRALGEANMTLEPPIMMHMDKLPNSNINKDEFADLVQILEVAMDHDTIKRLFQALTLEDSTVVDPDTFKVFYEAWKEVEMECVGFNVTGLHLESNECFIKVSATIKTTMGTGRLALTQKRLFLLHEGSSKVQEVIKLRDIQRLEKILQRSTFFSQVPALKVCGRDISSPPFIAWLKDARDSWHILVQEMWYGKLIQEELRDAGLLQQAAQNVLLIDAIIRSGEEENCYFHEDVPRAVSFLTYFTRCWAEGKGILAAETKDVLQHCVDPNVREPEKKAIETLLYMPGRRSSLVEQEDHGPKLWCGMGSGKMKVFDGSTWLVETPNIQAKDRIVCLLAVGDNQIWAGSLDTVIYVIDSVNKTCNHRLNCHTGMVVDLISAKENRLVYSAGIDGQIIGWSVQTLQRVREFYVPGVNALRSIHYDNNHFWCCNRDGLVLTDGDGQVLKEVEYLVDKQRLMMDCMLTMPHGQIWTGCRTEGLVAIWDSETLDLQKTIHLECRGVGCMVRVQDKIWIGTKSGVIFIVNMITGEREKQLNFHSDVIRSMCSAQTRYVMSGAGSQDGKIAIWRTSAA